MLDSVWGIVREGKMKLTEQLALEEELLAQGRRIPIAIHLEQVEPEKKVFRSEQFPGLWLNPEAVLAVDTAAVLKTLKRGLRSAAHAAFVAKTGHSEGKESSQEVVATILRGRSSFSGNTNTHGR